MRFGGCYEQGRCREIVGYLRALDMRILQGLRVSACVLGLGVGSKSLVISVGMGHGLNRKNNSVGIK